MKYRVIKSFPWNLNVWDLVYIEHPFIKYEKNGVDYKIGINEKDIEEYFVKEKDRPMSFLDLCKPYIPSWRYVDIWEDNEDNNSPSIKEACPSSSIELKAYRPTKEMAEAQLALSQLMQLRDAWRDGWKPENKTQWFPICICGKHYMRWISLETPDLRDLFEKTFEDLIDKILPLYFS